MKRGTFIVFFVLILILVSGVSKCQTGKKQAVGTRYIGGSEGIIAEFVDGEPPESVLDEGNDQFSISLLLENKGEDDVAEGDARTTITGISQKAFSIASLTKTNEGFIEAKRKEGSNVIKGGEDYITYSASYKDDLFTNFITTIGVNYCYKYSTKAVADVCLRKNVVARSKETDQCKIVEPKVVSSSGAPIQITSLEERASKTNEVAVTFVIENKAKGDTFSPESFSSGDCVESQEKQNKDFVRVKVSSQEGLNIKCSKFGDSAEGNVRLVQGLTTVMCKIDTGGLQETTYTSPLDIDITYNYKDFVSKQITVENSV